MAKIWVSRASTLGKKVKTNAGFKKIIGNATISKSVKRKLFKAFVSEAQGHAVRSDDLRKMYKKASELGVGRNTLLKISGKISKGESASSRLRYVGDKETVNEKSSSSSQKSAVDMNSVMDEIRAKKQKTNESFENAQKNDRSRSKISDFGVSEKNLRKAASLFVHGDDEQETLRQSTLGGYLINRQEGNYDMDKIQERIMRIQENSEKSEDSQVNVKNDEKEMPKQEEKRFNAGGYVASLHKKGENMDAIKDRLAKIQENSEKSEDSQVNVKNDEKEMPKQEGKKSDSGTFISSLHKKGENMDKIKKRLAEIQGKTNKEETIKKSNKYQDEKYSVGGKDTISSSSQKEIISENVKKQYSDYAFQGLNKGVIAESGFDLYEANDKQFSLFQNLMNKSEKEIENYIYDSAKELSAENTNIRDIKKEKSEILSSLSEELIAKSRSRNLSENTREKIEKSIAEIERILKIIEKTEEIKSTSKKIKGISDNKKNNEDLKKAA